MPPPVIEPSQEWVDEQFYAIVTDLVGTATELVDADANLAWRQRTTLWGSEVGREASDGYCPLRLPGQYFDPESGLHYNYRRYYEPASARYQSADPIGLEGGPNPHLYVRNPTRWSDPLGLQGCPIHSRYPDGTPVYRSGRPGKIQGPDPAADGAPHTVLRWDDANNRVYKAREFGEGGVPVKDIDFTHPTFPNGTPRPDHVAPEQHRWEPNPTGGTPRRGPGEPLEMP
jgi:RHS repeat-associated protein